MAVIRLERPFGAVEAPRTLQSIKDAIFGALDVRYMAGRLCWTLFIAFLTVEGILAGRLWVQLSGGSTDAGFFGSLYRWSAPLVAPFAHYEDVVPVRETGIFDFATIAAMEAYLVITLVVLITLLVVPRVLTFFITLIRGGYKLGEKHPRVVFAMDAVKLLESGSPGMVRASHLTNKPDRHGASVQARTRPTRGRSNRHSSSYR